ncbi:MAG: lysylphosphatidylglycerol synthase transmembrane domain-containing protein [Acidimicrobiia bacterium]|nr:lysylphosphatidylglycerol synthase transmembrane domain-containing protein [Acidimicrobiia bacterium]
MRDTTQQHRPVAKEDKNRSLAKRLAQGALSLAIVAGIFVGVMPRIADYGEVWATIRSLTWLESVSLAAVALWNLATYWFVLVAALPGFRLREAAVVNQASTAVSNTLPGGGAIGVGVTLAMLTSWGFRLTAITRSAVVTGIWNNFVKLGMPIVALGLLAIERDVSSAWLSASAIGLLALVGAIVVLAMTLRSDRLARSVGTSLGRIVSRLRSFIRKEPVGDWGERAAAFRRDTIGLLQHRWLQLTLATVLSHLSLYAVLLITLRHVGVSQEELSWIQVLAAFAFVRLISALPITPGGVGVVELGYAAALTIGLDEITKAQVVAAILVFRVITYALPVPLGAASYVIWRRNRSWRISEEDRDQLAGDAHSVT